MSATPQRLGILVGGGPAPGINSAINACAIEAVNSGLEVVGIYDGFEHLAKGRTDMVRPLSISDVSQIHTQGGSILRTSRVNPARSPEDLAHCVEALRGLGVSYLVTIGGDDTAFSALEVARAALGAFRVAHIPKTIDNDLPLPEGLPTFGFETARHRGTELVLNLKEDSRTTNRWYFVVVMGRKAGHLALGIGKAAGATLTIIPEEFTGPRVTLDEVASVLEGAILKRLIMGRQDGLAIIAEGIGEMLDPEELAAIPGVEVSYDPHGHIRLGEIPLATILRREVQRRLAELHQERTMVELSLGYELRSAPPIPFDIDYTRTLGYGAVNFLLSGSNEGGKDHGAMVYLEKGNLATLPLEDLRGSDGRTRIRLVDTNSQTYEVARKYMLRLERTDLEDPDTLAKLAEVAHLTPAEVEERFGPVVGLGAKQA